MSSIQQGKSFDTYVLVGYFIFVLKICTKCVHRLGSSQCSPQTMHAWGKMRNFIILKQIHGDKGYFLMFAISVHSIRKSIFRHLWVKESIIIFLLFTV